MYQPDNSPKLETGLGGSINMEVLERVGATNVAAAAGRGGLTKVSLEQVLAWNPDGILALDPMFYRSVAADPLWSSVKAVRDARIYLAPNLPYGWFDAPPGVNRPDRGALADVGPLSAPVSGEPTRYDAGVL